MYLESKLLRCQVGCSSKALFEGGKNGGKVEDGHKIGKGAVYKLTFNCSTDRPLLDATVLSART